jgi:uncharacterized protein YggU (UPF0235/DUF167 family)
VLATGVVRVHVTAAPADGAANEAVCKLLADAIDVSKTSVRIVRGERSRDKQVSIEGVSLESVFERLRSCREL